MLKVKRAFVHRIDDAGQDKCVAWQTETEKLLCASMCSRLDMAVH